MTVQLREMDASDIEAGLRLCRTVGWNQLESDWRCFLDWNPLGCRVAVRDGVVVGTVATLRFEGRFGWISMVLVDPAVRGLGIGSALLLDAVRLLEDVETARLDATAAGKAVYERYGFQDEYPLVRMRALGPTLDAAAPGARPMAASDLPGILDFDRAVFGADRGALLHHLYRTAPEYAFIAESAGGIQGYSFGRNGFRAEHLGPVVAADEDSARGLLSLCLARNRGRQFSLDAPRHTGTWTRWLESLGFVEERPFVRMFRGSNAWPGIPGRQYAITGPEFG
jgi:ribosomal protein S18 acetylase RimI-like enzyme